MFIAQNLKPWINEIWKDLIEQWMSDLGLITYWGISKQTENGMVLQWHCKLMTYVCIPYFTCTQKVAESPLEQFRQQGTNVLVHVKNNKRFEVQSKLFLKGVMKKVN